MKRILALSLGALLLNGCASDPPAPTTDPAVDALVQAAHDVQKQINVISGIDKADHPGFRSDVFGGKYPSELAKTATLSWSGPLDKLVQKLCDQAGVPLRITGPLPVTPVLVYINASDERIGDILRDAGSQAGAAAELIVHADVNPLTVEIAYVPNS